MAETTLAELAGRFDVHPDKLIVLAEHLQARNIIGPDGIGNDIGVYDDRPAAELVYFDDAAAQTVRDHLGELEAAWALHEVREWTRQMHIATRERYDAIARAKHLADTRRGLTVEQIADAAGITRDAVYKLLAKDPERPTRRGRT